MKESGAEHSKFPTKEPQTKFMLNSVLNAKTTSGDIANHQSKGQRCSSIALSNAHNYYREKSWDTDLKSELETMEQTLID